MTERDRHCAACGAALATQSIEGVMREVCPACGRITYRNPLPVAATVVLNEQREVLLVKRLNEPYRGMWCLPIGFAERNETIEEAALRELHEEAGIIGRVLRLLDTDSQVSSFYGDLLIVTFEVTALGGQAQAGDDAAEVAYFPIDELPELAFTSNAKALAVCRALHADEWAIRESFDHLVEDAPATMLSDELIALIRGRAAEIATLWIDDIQVNPTTRTYRQLSREELFAQVSLSLSQLSRWWQGEDVVADMRSAYRRVGRRRAEGGFALDEVLSALMLLRKHIWTFARQKGIWRRPIEVYRVLELDRRLVLYFDRAMYYSSQGHDVAARKRT